MAATHTVLIVEDDAHIRRLLRGALVRAGHGVVEADSARAGLALAATETPAVVLLDLGLPDRDGLELVELLRQRTDATLIVVSARTDTDEKVAALDLGADDYVTKPFDTEELLARIRTALRHRAAAAGEVSVIRFGEVLVDHDRRRVTRGGRDVHLTPKEFEVLCELTRNPDRVVSHVAILRAVWGPAHDSDIDYLRIIIRALRRKLEPNPAQPEWLINEPGVGYRLRTSVR